MKQKRRHKNKWFYPLTETKSLHIMINSTGYYFRACTGFDGGFEVEAAIRRLLDCVPTGKLNINANEQYALAA